jgi:hypothetical protein
VGGDGGEGESFNNPPHPEPLPPGERDFFLFISWIFQVNKKKIRFFTLVF